MILTETTRELILDKIDKLKDKLDLLNRLMQKNEYPEFHDFHSLEYDILNRAVNTLTKTIIKNEYVFE